FPLVQSAPVLHALGAHGVAAYLAHPPLPSQRPFCPHAGEPSSLQLPCGSLPANAGPQTPSARLVDARAQPKRFEVYAGSQHTPSPHSYDVHVSPDLHGAPFPSRARISAVAVAAVADVLPPATRIRPSPSAVAVWSARGCDMSATATHCFADES